MAARVSETMTVDTIGHLIRLTEVGWDHSQQGLDGRSPRKRRAL